MENRAKTAVQAKREAQFVQNMAAFMRRDFETIEATWRPDVVMEMPGTSWLAGTPGAQGGEPLRPGIATGAGLGGSADDVPP